MGYGPRGRIPFAILPTRKRPSPSHDFKPYDTIGTFFRREFGNCLNFLRLQFGREIRRQFGNQQLATRSRYRTLIANAVVQNT